MSYKEETNLSKAKKPLNPMSWGIILTIVLMKDILLDPLENICVTGIQVIPVVGQALGGVVTTLVFFTGLIIDGSILLYWFFNGVNVFSVRSRKNMAKKMTLKACSFLGLFLDFIPIISILPWTTIYFYLNVKMENEERAEMRKEEENQY